MWVELLLAHGRYSVRFLTYHMIYDTTRYKVRIVKNVKLKKGAGYMWRKLRERKAYKTGNL